MENAGLDGGHGQAMECLTISDPAIADGQDFRI
jgi:hypothetical protein